MGGPLKVLKEQFALAFRVYVDLGNEPVHLPVANIFPEGVVVDYVQRKLIAEFSSQPGIIASTISSGSCV